MTTMTAGITAAATPAKPRAITSTNTSIATEAEWLAAPAKDPPRHLGPYRVGLFARLAEEPVADEDGRHHARQVRQQCATHGMAYALDTHRPEIHGQYIEGGFGAALHGRRHQRGKAVHAMVLHRLDQHGTCCATREWLDQHGGQRVDEARVQADDVHQPANAVQAEFQCAGRAQYADRAKHGDQV